MLDMSKNDIDKKHTISKLCIKSIILMIFLAYMLKLFDLVFFRYRFAMVRFYGDNIFNAYKNYFRASFNIIPFRTIGEYLMNPYNLSLNIRITNIGGNILAFMPFGFLAPVIFKKLSSFKKILLSSFILSTVIEILQMIFLVGSFDIDDIILNTAGGALGFLIFYIFYLMKIRTIRYVKSK